MSGLGIHDRYHGTEMERSFIKIQKAFQAYMKCSELIKAFLKTEVEESILNTLNYN